MSPADVVRALLEALEAGDEERARELVADDFAATTHVGGRVIDREAYLAGHVELDAAFGDLHREILELREVSPGVVRVRMRVTATNDRPVRLPMLGVDLPTPTGRVLRTVPNTDHFTVRDGRVVSYRSEQPPGSGLAGLLDQIRQES